MIDGLQRLSYAGLYRAKGIVIEEDGAEFYEVQYEEKMIDEDGNFIVDEDGDIKKELKTFNVLGKKFDELPKFLQDRFNKFNINVTTYFDCTDEQIAYHIRNYNNHESMTGNQYEITNMSPKMVTMVKDISSEHSFFKNRYGNYTDKNDTKGLLDRTVSESIMCINFLNDWKKKPEDLFEYIDENATKDMFESFKEYLTRLCDIVDKGNKKLFNTTNSPVWFTVFSRFTKLAIPDSKFTEFTKYFIESLETLKVNGKDFINTYKNTGTKDKAIVIAKINGIEKIMMEFLHINTEEAQSEYESVISNEVVISDSDENISVLDFVKENVTNDIDSDDIELYEMSLEDYSVEIDNNKKQLLDKNIKAFVALIAYAFNNEVDTEIPNWLIDFTQRNTTYNKDQKENYLHMKNDLEKYLDKKGSAT